VVTVAEWIVAIIDAQGADTVVQKVRGEVLELCRRFPVYGV
jgi:glycine/serine hydroxymethyltransferase